MSPLRYLYSQQALPFCLYKPFPGILQHTQIYCAVILYDSAFISFSTSAIVVTNNTETLFCFLRDRCKSCRAALQRHPGLVQMAVGYKASQWASQVPAGPVLTMHLWPDLITGWHLGPAAVRAKSALWIETNYGVFCFFVMCPVGAKSVSPSC